MNRMEFYQKAKTYDIMTLKLILVHALTRKDQVIDAILAKASDDEINKALHIAGKDERITS